MNSCVLSGLTQEEATEALRIALHRHPALQFRVVASADPTGAYELVLDADDAQRYDDIVDAVNEEARPLRLRIRQVEISLAQQVLNATMPRASAEVQAKALTEICLLLEYRLVPYFFELGDFVDGFACTSVRYRDRELVLVGQCWCFAGGGRQAQGEFEAVLGLTLDGTLSRFELGFMSATAIRATHVLPARMPEYCEKLIAGYRVEIRAGQPSENDEAVSSQWAFHVRKTD